MATLTQRKCVAYERAGCSEQPTEVWRINHSGRFFVNLLLEDVKPARDVPADAKQIEFVSETFDGLRIRMRLYDIGAEPLVVLKAEFEESLVAPAKESSQTPAFCTVLRPTDTDEGIQRRAEGLEGRATRAESAVAGILATRLSKRRYSLARTRRCAW